MLNIPDKALVDSGFHPGISIVARLERVVHDEVEL